MSSSDCSHHLPEHERRAARRDEIAQKVALLKKLPRPPQLLRGGDSIFLSSGAAYPSFVRQQRTLRQEHDIAQRNNRFLVKQLTQQRQQQQSRAPSVSSKSSRPDSAGSQQQQQQQNLPAAAYKHVAREQVKQWLVMIQVARFLYLPMEAAKLVSVIKLRKLMAPVIRRARQRIKHKRRLTWLLVAAQSKMTKPTVLSLKQSSGFFRAWPDEALRRLLDHHMVPSSESCNTVLVMSGTTVADVFISDSGELGVFSARQLHPWSAVETTQTRSVKSSGCVLLGDLSVAAHFDLNKEKEFKEARKRQQMKNRAMGIYDPREPSDDDNDEDSGLDHGGRDNDDEDPHEAERRRQRAAAKKRARSAAQQQLLPSYPPVFKFALELRALGLGTTTMFWRIPHQDVMEAFRKRLSPQQQLQACAAARTAYLDVTAPLDPSRVTACLSRYDCTFPIEFVRALDPGVAAAAAIAASTHDPLAAAPPSPSTTVIPTSSWARDPTLKPCFFTAGTELFAAGERPKHFFIIVSGCVVLSSSSSSSAGMSLANSGMFGSAAAFSPSPSSGAATFHLQPSASSSIFVNGPGGGGVERVGPWTCLDLVESLICSVPRRSRTATCETDVEAYAGDFHQIHKLFLYGHSNFVLAVRGAMMRVEASALQQDTYAQHQARLRHLLLMQQRSQHRNSIDSAGMLVTPAMQSLKKQQMTELEARIKQNAALYGVDDDKPRHARRAFRSDSVVVSAAAADRPISATRNLRSVASSKLSPRAPSSSSAMSAAAAASRRVSIPHSLQQHQQPPVSDLAKALVRTPLFAKLPEDVIIALVHDAVPYICLPGDSLLFSMRFGPSSGAAAAAAAAAASNQQHDDGFYPTHNQQQQGGGFHMPSAATSSGPGLAIVVRGTVVVRLVKEHERLMSMSAPSKDEASKKSSSSAAGGGKFSNAENAAGDDAAAEMKFAHLSAMKDHVAEERDPALFLPHSLKSPVLLGAHSALCGAKNSLAATLGGGGKISVTAADNDVRECCVWWEVSVASIREAVSPQEFDQIAAMCKQRTSQADNCFAGLVV